MAEAAGEENFFLFGLTAEQVQSQPRLVQPPLALRNEPETRRALDLIPSGPSAGRAGVFSPIVDALLTHGDHYMHLADLTCLRADPGAGGPLYQQPDAWPGDPQRRTPEVLQRSHDPGIRPDIWGERGPAMTHGSKTIGITNPSFSRRP